MMDQRDVAWVALGLRAGWLPIPRHRVAGVKRVFLKVGAVGRQALIEALLDAFMADEAAALSDEERWRVAAAGVTSGRLASGWSGALPERWEAIFADRGPMAMFRRASCAACPPVDVEAAGWASGGSAPSWAAIVGSRRLPMAWREGPFWAAFVSAVASLGHGVVSGGCWGVDALAAEAAEAHGVRLLEVLPCEGWGPRGAVGLGPASVQLSLYPSSSRFAAAYAMERNALVYGAASIALVLAPRFKVGGTWHGAVEALRRRFTQVLVIQTGHPDHVLAERALCALGARPLFLPGTEGFGRGHFPGGSGAGLVSSMAQSYADAITEALQRPSGQPCLPLADVG